MNVEFKAGDVVMLVGKSLEVTTVYDTHVTLYDEKENIYHHNVPLSLIASNITQEIDETNVKIWEDINYQAPNNIMLAKIYLEYCLSRKQEADIEFLYHLLQA